MATIRLEEFAAETPTVMPEPEGDGDEGIRLAAYEEGYAAGWEDATTACADAKAEREAEVARNLMMLSLAHEEAARRVVLAMEPLLTGIASRLLPQMAQATLVPLVCETLLPMAETVAGRPIRLEVSIGARDAVEQLVPPQAHGATIQIVENAALSAGQVRLSDAQAETLVDLDAAVSAILQSISDFYALQRGGLADAG